jgi:hypothetical protein
VAAALALLLGSGCARAVVVVYQPVSGLHRAVAIDPQLPNFTDTRLDVRCIRGPLLNDAQAGVLCDRVDALFSNQGAVVHTYVGEGPLDPDGPVAVLDDVGAGSTAAEPRTRLSMELRSRETEASNHPFSWVLYAASLTLVPGVIESSFAQEIVIRDDSGFLLVSDTLEGRIVTRYGVGPWLGNGLLDLARKKEDRLGEDAASKDLSADLYRQLSQDVFNAKMRARVLRQAMPVGRAE